MSIPAFPFGPAVALQSSADGPPLVLLIVFYGFMFVVLPGVGALASATLLARRNRTGVTVASTLAAIPIVGYELFARNVETTVAFGGALLVGAYLGGAVALLVRGDHESDDRLVVGGATLWTALLVGIALSGGYVAF